MCVVNVNNIEGKKIYLENFFRSQKDGFLVDEIINDNDMGLTAFQIMNILKNLCDRGFLTKYGKKFFVIKQ